MNHALAKVAAASGLAAAAATPFTLSAFAGNSPVPSVPAAVNAVTSQVSASVAQVAHALGLQSLPVSLPSSVSASPAADPPGEAPAATASANAVSIPVLDTCVSCTNVDAGDGSADSNATALRILGHDVSAGHLSGNDSGGNALIALPANPLLSLAIADWMAATQTGNGSSSANSRASLVDLGLGPNGQVATLAVLEANSSAQWNASSSHGSAFTNGARLNLGNGALVVILLHSDADSDGTSHAYVASINGTSILSNTQIGQPITITIPGVITITLLQSQAGGGFAVGSVATGSNLLGMPGQQLGLFTSSGAGNTGQASNPGTGVEAASTVPDLGVPETGIAIGALGFLLAAGGALAAVASRVRRHSTSA